MTKLLIVEDDPKVRDTLTRRLNREGFQTLTANNGVQTIVLARSERPDLILLDLDLPLLNGWQVAKRLRSLSETCTIPIIVLAEAMPTELSQPFFSYRCNQYEPKPLNYPQLIAKIRWLTPLTYTHGLYTREAGVI